MAKVTRKGKVKHIILNPNDNMAQVYAMANLTEPGMVDDLVEFGLDWGHDVIDVEYDQDHEENYVRPKGQDMGHGCYWVKGSPLASGLKNVQRALKTGWRDASRG